MAANRLQRWAHFLSAYDFDIIYIRSNQNSADFFSRRPVYNAETEMLNNITYLMYVQNDLLLNYKLIKEESRKDPILSNVIFYVLNGGHFVCKA